jgi:type II secretory pathway pseudopilin PulG
LYIVIIYILYSLVNFSYTVQKIKKSENEKISLFTFLIVVSLTSYATEYEVVGDDGETYIVEEDDEQEDYVCDGRKYCSQMTSCAETIFFINNCPDTKMDGDDDGRPCERQLSLRLEVVTAFRSCHCV